MFARIEKEIGDDAYIKNSGEDSSRVKWLAVDSDMKDQQNGNSDVADRHQNEIQVERFFQRIAADREIQQIERNHDADAKPDESLLVLAVKPPRKPSAQ